MTFPFTPWAKLRSVAPSVEWRHGATSEKSHTKSQTVRRKGCSTGRDAKYKAVVRDCQWDSTSSYDKVQGMKNKPHHHSHLVSHCSLCQLCGPEWRGKSAGIYVFIGQGLTAKLSVHLRLDFYPRRWGRRWFQVEQRTKGRLEVEGGFFQNFIQWGSNVKQWDYLY